MVTEVHIHLVEAVTPYGFASTRYSPPDHFAGISWMRSCRSRGASHEGREAANCAAHNERNTMYSNSITEHLAVFADPHGFAVTYQCRTETIETVISAPPAAERSESGAIIMGPIVIDAEVVTP
jgi:hypothetical protein